ncbi:hypothetical protein QJQ45_003997 [Haematococcus lacustris]|nr:hypothetical protein QJQ45_003997 [Haematococcus lacustris]
MACGYGINAQSSELQAANLDKGHVADLVEEADKHRRLLGMKQQGSLQDTLPLPCHMRHAVHVCRWLEQWQQPPTPPVPGQPKRGKPAGSNQAETKAAFTSEPALSHHWARWFNTGELRNKEFASERTVDTDGVSVCVHYTCPLPPPPAPPPAASSNSRPSAAAAAAHAVGLPHIGKGIAEQRDFVFDSATQIGVGIDPGVTQAVSAVSAAWHPKSGQLVADKPGRVEADQGPAASSAGTSLVANLMHISVTLATWAAVWEVYLDPMWARQRLGLYRAQDRGLEQFFKKLEKDMAEVSMERHGRAKQLVLFFGAPGIGTQGGWGADTVLRAYCKVVSRPRGTDQLRGRVVLVDEHRTTRVSSAVNGKQPCEEELDHEQPTRRAGWKPPAGQVEQRLLRPAWSQQHDQPQPCGHTASSLRAGAQHSPPAKRSKRTKAEQAAEPTQPTKAAKVKPAPQPGRWLDRDCNAALNMQRIGESRWRPLELCYWPDRGALPAKGKEYPGLGYKRLRDKPPKAQQQP